MAKRTMSAAARRRIAEAARQRWARYREAKAAGKPVPRMGPRRGRRGRRGPMGVRRGRPPGRPGRPPASGNPYLGLTVEALITAKRQIDQAMKRVQDLLAAGG